VKKLITFWVKVDVVDDDALTATVDHLRSALDEVCDHVADVDDGVAAAAVDAHDVEDDEGADG